jgi:hypothetical protein
METVQRFKLHARLININTSMRLDCTGCCHITRCTICFHQIALLD